MYRGLTRIKIETSDDSVYFASCPSCIEVLPGLRRVIAPILLFGFIPWMFSNQILAVKRNILEPGLIAEIFFQDAHLGINMTRSSDRIV